MDKMEKSRSVSRKDSQVPFNPEALAAITETNSSTPLLRIPLEIRNQIYELVCGGQLLHIDHYWNHDTGSPESQFTHRICCAEISEEAADDLFHAEATAQWFVSGIEDRHEDCSGYKEHAEKISTGFLATCRQVHNEARHILYTTNTFAFNQTIAVNQFTYYLQNSGYGHHLEIRRVHLDIMTENFTVEQEWKMAIRHYLIPRFPEIRRISINLDLHFPASSMGSRTPAEFEACQPFESFRYPLMSAFLELGELPLSRVSFVISDEEFFWIFGMLGNPPRSTLAEKQAWARYIKDCILRKAKQLATSSDLAVETRRMDVNAELVKPGLLGG